MTRPAISPVIWYREPRAALAWLEAAFGFETTLVVDDGQGGVMHSETMIEGGVVMIVGPPRDKATTPIAFGGRATQSVHVQLREGIDTHCERARAAGAKIGREPQTQAYGDRVYTCLDLEDHPWSFGQTVTVLTADEQAKATGHDIATSL